MITAPPRSVRPKTPQSVFDGIARRYDVLNTIISFGFDRRWRQRAILSLDFPRGGLILDVATGTGAVARLAAAKLGSGGHVFGCDRNESMLAVGHRQLSGEPSRDLITFVRAFGEALPFRDSVFDAITIAFAIDDMDEPHRCATEMYRVLKPSGQVALVELSLPQHPLLLRLYQQYLQFMHFWGNNDGARHAYDHLRKEILNWRGNEAIRKLLIDAGFIRIRQQALTLGIATLYCAEKPDRR